MSDPEIVAALVVLLRRDRKTSLAFIDESHRVFGEFDRRFRGRDPIDTSLALRLHGTKRGLVEGETDRTFLVLVTFEELQAAIAALRSASP